MIIRVEVALDDQWHTVRLCGPVLHVAAREDGWLEFWTLFTDSDDETPHDFRVFATGQPMQADLQYSGTAFASDGRVWHLMERP